MTEPNATTTDRTLPTPANLAASLADVEARLDTLESWDFATMVRELGELPEDFGDLLTRDDLVAFTTEDDVDRAVADSAEELETKVADLRDVVVRLERHERALVAAGVLGRLRWLATGRLPAPARQKKGGR